MRSILYDPEQSVGTFLHLVTPLIENYPQKMSLILRAEKIGSGVLFALMTNAFWFDVRKCIERVILLYVHAC